jgi:hypothetical protein
MKNEASLDGTNYKKIRSTNLKEEKNVWNHY